MINISESEWASRAWTYQEAFFSRRRLIFTDRQVIFNCGTNFCLESGSALPSQDLEFLASLWTCRKTELGNQVVSGHISCMEQYCGRKLTKDSDALNAILSTLGTVSGRNCYHIWGVPVECRGQNCTSNNKSQSILSDSRCDSGPYDPKKTSIWLSWHHRGDASRRPGFPSWSPLGWADAPITWDETSHFTGAVSVHTPVGIDFLSDYLSHGNEDPNEMPQLLGCRMKTATFHLNNGYLQIPVGKGYYIRELVDWHCSSFTTNEPMKTAVISESRRCIRVLLLIAVSDHYERIGYSKIQTSLDILNPRWDLVIQEDKSYRRIKSYPHDDKRADRERLRAAFGGLDKYEWAEHVFKEEYITIG